MSAREGIERLARRGLLTGLAAGISPLLARFELSLRAPERAQRRVRERLTRALATTEYGAHLGVRGAADWDRRVPIVDYDELEPWLRRQRETEARVVTPDRVICYEKTSGSSGPAKYIPYTASLRRAFSRMFAIWASDLILRGPGLTTGKLYISISPSFSHETNTARDVPVGLADDRDYLDGWLRALVRPFAVTDPAAARAPDAASFIRRTAILLVGEPRLEVISVWSPSLLKLLVDEIDANRETIAAALGRLSADRRRALLAAPTPWHQLWPELKLISCWASAGAAPQARALAALFPRAVVQGKGLLATEAPVTVPLAGGRGYAPLVEDVLIELETEAGALVPVYAAREGAEYALVVSQSGGLYRYRLGDRVIAGPRIGATPTLELLGRTRDVSDLVGEKLAERFVEGVLAELCPNAFLRALVPVREPVDHYVLMVDGGVTDTAVLARALDTALSRAHHYRHARALGQLGAARVYVGREAAELIAEDGRARGIKLGDLKPRALSPVPAGDALAARLRDSAGPPQKEAS